MDLVSLLTVLFVGLKLGGIIDWSWLAVTSPLWGWGLLCGGWAALVTYDNYKNGRL